MVLKRAVALADNPAFRQGYWLILRKSVLKTPCPDGGHFLTEYNICRKLTAKSAQKLGRVYTQPLTLMPEVNEETDRWDLRVDLHKPGGGAHHIRYHRLVGLALKKATHPRARAFGQRSLLERPAAWRRRCCAARRDRQIISKNRRSIWSGVT